MFGFFRVVYGKLNWCRLHNNISLTADILLYWVSLSRNRNIKSLIFTSWELNFAFVVAGETWSEDKKVKRWVFLFFEKMLYMQTFFNIQRCVLEVVFFFCKKWWRLKGFYTCTLPLHIFFNVFNIMYFDAFIWTIFPRFSDDECGNLSNFKYLITYN